MLSDFLIYAGMLFACFLLIEWNRRVSQFGSNDLIENALGAIAVALGIAGYQDLDRCGHLKVRRILRNCLFAWFGVYLVLFAIILISKTTVFDFAFAYSLYPLVLLIVAPFPLALYMNRNQPKSTSQPTSAKAS
jgi:hypothetical protein